MAAPAGPPEAVKLLLDEMHSHLVAEALARDGHDVIAAVATPRLRGLADADLLAEAAADERAVVTENVRDFLPLVRMWVAEGRGHAGLLLTHPRRFDRSSLSYPGTLITALQHFLTEPPVVGPWWVWWLA